MNLLIIWRWPLWFWCKAKTLRGPLEGLGHESRDFFGPWNSSRESCLGPKKSFIGNWCSLVILCKWEQSGCSRAQTLHGPGVEWGGGGLCATPGLFQGPNTSRPWCGVGGRGSLCYTRAVSGPKHFMALVWSGGEGVSVLNQGRKVHLLNAPLKPGRKKKFNLRPAKTGALRNRMASRKCIIYISVA